ncbi:MAG: diversity-generating retroelement protein Avd [Candidatus Firestonebacteria bacterium]
MEYKRSELIIFTKTYDFILWMMNHTMKFPKSSRFSISARIENKLLDFMEMILIANRQRDKLEKLYYADGILEQVRILFRLSKDMKFISLNSYEYAVKELTEIGKLLGAWIKQQKVTFK